MVDPQLPLQRISIGFKIDIVWTPGVFHFGQFESLLKFAATRAGDRSSKANPSSISKTFIFIDSKPPFLPNYLFFDETKVAQNHQENLRITMSSSELDNLNKDGLCALLTQLKVKGRSKLPTNSLRKAKLKEILEL